MILCNKCKGAKDASDFYGDKSRKSGISRWCKVCMKVQNTKWKSENTSRVSEYNIRYRKSNATTIRQVQKLYRQVNRDSIQESDMRYRIDNRDKVRKWRRKYYYSVVRNSPEKRLLNYYRNSLRKHLIRKLQKSSKDFIGCTTEDLRHYIESQWSENMSWDNYGKAWHIDHIIPCARFDLTNEQEVTACFHYTNLQPLGASDNMSKQDKLPADFDRREWLGGRWVVHPYGSSQSTSRSKSPKGSSSPSPLSTL